ncbi:MAG TPA: FAD binding domain-containing protein [Trebonia sp.]|jgi:CO/xanthine dehydrogenase FAD-binding subunit|nr:FAD binding domain-containing protein [Trebonia sp.]
MDIDTVTEFAPAPGATWRDGDAWLGGGTWLFSQPQPGVRRLLDLQEFGWPALTQTAAGLEIAATCTLAELRVWRPSDRGWLAAALAPACCDALLGSFKVQHMATVGGNICLSLPAGPMTSLAAALDGVGTLIAPSGATREVAVADFVTGDGTNVLTPGELLRKVFVAAAALRCRTAFRHVSLSPAGRSAVLVIARASAGAGAGGAHGGGETVVTVTAATPRPLRLRFDGLPGADAVVAALDEREPGYLDDMHGDAYWRRAMTRRCVAETVAELAG